MKKSLMALMVVVLAFGMVIGCVHLGKNVPAIGLGGIGFDDLTRNQYVILDTVEGSGETKVYLGFFQVPLETQQGFIGPFEKVQESSTTAGNIVAALGKAANAMNQAQGGGNYNVQAPPPGVGGQLAAYQMAIYSALSKVPDADGLLPISSNVKMKKEILGLIKTYTVTVKGKAIRVKTDKELGCGKGSCETQPTAGR